MPWIVVLKSPQLDMHHLGHNRQILAHAPFEQIIAPVFYWVLTLNPGRVNFIG
jgi:hypothetical protein